ncbi:HD-GYP domain-containing protein [Sphingomonas sp.]|uniref:HD-GYP domain-containing protein n=1 Tax=Sphingomonas sp. TaxID=28214 RepID=UPI001B1B8D0F|nr:HD-GYP domain-containing protein [Sphingomonas sp.]MBO9715131.1 HD-GYP domain-containing protein [Sphingomonas sp.]
MLKRIPPKEVTLGMFVHSLEGEWLSHPFWRKKFLVTKSTQLDELRRSGVRHVVVDVGRSVDAPMVTPLRPAVRRAAPQQKTERYVADLQHTNRVVADARRLMKGVFERAADGEATAVAEVEAVVESISDTLDRNREMLLGVVRLRSRDEYTYFHSVSVATLMINFARELKLPEEVARLMGIAGLFHDLGKMRVAPAILNKPGRLTVEEFAEIKNHPGYGHELLKLTDNVPAIALDVCLHHHEKMDGSGYPHGLKEGEISLAARMGAICDVYDALTAARPYKDASSPVAAIAMMANWKGHFDTDLLFRFMKSIGVFPVGMLVLLRSGHLAIVRDNGRRASRARLSLFYDIHDKQLIPTHEIYLSDIKGTNLIVEPANPEAYDLPNWGALKDVLLSGRDPSLG